MELDEINVNTYSQNKEVTPKMKVFKSTLSGQNITADNMEKAEKISLQLTGARHFKKNWQSYKWRHGMCKEQDSYSVWFP